MGIGTAIMLALTMLGVVPAESMDGLPVQDAMRKGNDDTLKLGAGALSDSDIHTAFAVLDSDGSSTLTKSELRLGMQRLSLPLTEDELKALLSDESTISFNTFAKLLRQ